MCGATLEGIGAYSSEGRCGPWNGGLACNPHTKLYTVLGLPFGDYLGLTSHRDLLAARSMDGVVILMSIAERAASLAAQHRLVEQIPQHLAQSRSSWLELASLMSLILA